MRFKKNFGLALWCLAAPAIAADFPPDLASLASVPEVSLPAVAVEKALAEAPRKDRPFHYAARVATRFSLAHGSWDALASGEHRWRLRIASPGARSLSLHFDPFRLPEGAAVWIYDERGALVHGPYRAEHATRLGLWTPIVHGDRIVVEARLPAAEAPNLQLGIAHAYHGYRGWKESGYREKAGSCNIDVACHANGEWADEIRSVARIQIDGSVLCSGQLVNNIEQNLDPLFLTADHCGIGDAASNAPAESVVFYWNYQASECGGPLLASSTTQSGSEFVADNLKSDFTLLRLLAQPETVADVYYAGWNASGAGGSSGVSIHHPSGDEKSISFFSSSLQAVEANIEKKIVKAWRVARWTQGTTEAGSSGAGLWNQAHEIVGVLTGGDAACDNTNGEDFFGRLSAGWSPAGSGPPDQLRAHLDPTCSGRMKAPGLDPGDPAVPLATGPGCELGTGGGGGGGGGGPLAPWLLLPLSLGAAFRIRA